MLPLTKEEKKLYHKQFYICQKEFSYKDKKRYKVWD